MKAPIFYSKILLFGEYGIIKDSKGLSIPFNYFKGGLKVGDSKNENQKISNQNLKKFRDYLLKINTDIVKFDHQKFDIDLVNGMYFDSSIPQGYGVGSSGAIVAAIYDRYALNKITVLENLTKQKILVLKNIFSEMESFFHGKSSGLDPLNSYLSLPILIHSKDEVETTGIPSQDSIGKGAVFLLDSGKSSDTAPMVEIFFKLMENKKYKRMINDEFIKVTDSCVEDFLNANFNSLFKHIKILSKLVLKNFKPMIPKDFHNVWAKGIESDEYFLEIMRIWRRRIYFGICKRLQ